MRENDLLEPLQIGTTGPTRFKALEPIRQSLNASRAWRGGTVSFKHRPCQTRASVCRCWK